LIEEKGHTNVKVVRGGGEAMEKYFDYFRGKIVSPMTGKETIVQP